MVSKMKIIFEKENNRHGNDCLIEECYSIIEVFDKYLALHITHYSGWFGTDNGTDSAWCDSYNEAMKKLKKFGLES